MLRDKTTVFFSYLGHLTQPNADPRSVRRMLIGPMALSTQNVRLFFVCFVFARARVCGFLTRAGSFHGDLTVPGWISAFSPLSRSLFPFSLRSSPQVGLHKGLCKVIAHAHVRSLAFTATRLRVCVCVFCATPRKREREREGRGGKTTNTSIVFSSSYPGFSGVGPEAITTLIAPPSPVTHTQEEDGGDTQSFTQVLPFLCSWREGERTGKREGEREGNLTAGRGTRAESSAHKKTAEVLHHLALTGHSKSSYPSLCACVHMCACLRERALHELHSDLPKSESCGV